MSLRIIEGKIGSGKTYWVVNHIAKNYFTFDSDRQSWVAKNSCEVISNIDELKINSKSLDDEINVNGGLPSFFNVEFQKRYCQDRRVLYVIDEAQGPKYFHRKFYNPDVFFFFQYHRHLGIDIYLVTQDVASLAKELRELAEYHIEAVRRSKSLMGEFRYRWLQGEDCYKTTTLKPDKSVFALYKSADKRESEKVGSSSRRRLYFIVGFLVAAVLLFKFVFIESLMSHKSVETYLSKVDKSKPDKGVVADKSVEPVPGIVDVPVSKDVSPLSWTLQGYVDMSGVRLELWDYGDGFIRVVQDGQVIYRYKEVDDSDKPVSHPSVKQY